jgi:YD repeat-containing protein
MRLRLRSGLLMFLAIAALFFSSVIFSYAQSVNYYYDDSNRLIRVEYPDGTVIGYAYDETGNRIEEAVVPPATTLVSVSGPITTDTPTYTWNSVFGATLYCIKVDDSTGTKIDQCYTPAQAGCPDNTGTCSVTPAVQLSGGNGQWWVRVYDPAGYGPWSTANNFSVNPPPAATLVSPNGTTMTNQPTYTWNAVPGSSQYYLSVNDSTGPKIQQWYTAQEAGCPNGTGNCSVTPSTPLAEGGGQWWIQTYMGAALSFGRNAGLTPHFSNRFATQNESFPFR